MDAMLKDFTDIKGDDEVYKDSEDKAFRALTTDYGMHPYCARSWTSLNWIPLPTDYGKLEVIDLNAYPFDFDVDQSKFFYSMYI